MTLRVHYPALLGALLLAVHAAGIGAPKAAPEQQFGVIGHSFSEHGGEAQLSRALAKTRDAGLDFVVAIGIKGAAEPCSDAVYMRRRDMFADAKPPVIVAPAASDWAECKNTAGRLVSIERLNRMRELLYAEPGALGERPFMLERQSVNAKFRSYAENAYWVSGNVLYATLNIPSDNNHYRSEAGRNSEFEDRAVANRFWLNRLFGLARRKKLDALVLFSEGNLKVLSEEPGLLARLRRSSGAQDGFAAPRHQIVTLATQYHGKVLLIDSAPVASGSAPALAWHANLGHMSIGSRVVRVHVTPQAATMFKVEQP
jgi:hypothetical protein